MMTTTGMHRLQRLGLLLIAIGFFGLLQSCEKDSLTEPANSIKESRSNELTKIDRVALEEALRADEVKLAKLEEKAASLKQLAQEKLYIKKEEWLEKLEKQETAFQTKAKKEKISVPGDYDSLQEAINAASPGDKIKITADLSEQGDIYVHVPGLSIEGEGSVSPVIEGTGMILIADDIVIQGLNIEMEWEFILDGCSNVQVKGCRIQGTRFTSLFQIGSSNNKITNNSFTGTWGAILVDSHNNQFSNNSFEIISDEDGFAGSPIEIASSNGNVFNDCSFDSHFLNANMGVTMFDSNGNKFNNCVSENNLIAAFAGLNSHQNQFRQCVGRNSRRGWLLRNSDENKLVGCYATDNFLNGIVITDYDGERSENNQIQEFQAINNASVGIYLDEALHSELKGCVANQSFIGIYDYLGESNVIKDCSASYNVYGIAGDESVTGTYVQNVSNENSIGTILLLADAFLLSSNTSNSNTEFGILLDNTNNTTLTENSASGNGFCDLQVYGGVGNTIQPDNSFGTSCGDL